MTFDLKKFDTAKFRRRTAEEPVPELEEFFAEAGKKAAGKKKKNEPPVFRVQSLTGHELAEVKQAVRNNGSLEALAEALTSQVTKEQMAGFREALGLADKNPDDLVMRLAVLRLGCVDPAMEQSRAVRLADAYPSVFYRLTDRILTLTGQGKTLGESNASGTTRK